jgi:hypothetical protein
MLGNALEYPCRAHRALFPEHADKKVFGIIAAVDMSEMLKKRVLEAGFYVARIQDEMLC